MITRRRRRRATLTVASLVAVVAVTTAVDAQPAGAVPLPVNIDGFQDGFYVPIDDVVLGDAGDASVVANGNLAVTWAGSTLEPTFNEDDALTEFDSDLGLRGALTLELAADTTGDLDGSLEVLTVPLTPFEAGPVIVTPYLGIDVQFAGHAEAGAQLSLVAPFDVSAAISKLGGRPEASADERTELPTRDRPPRRRHRAGVPRPSRAGHLPDVHDVAQHHPDRRPGARRRARRRARRQPRSHPMVEPRRHRRLALRLGDTRRPRRTAAARPAAVAVPARTLQHRSRRRRRPRVGRLHPLVTGVRHLP